MNEQTRKLAGQACEQVFGGEFGEMKLTMLFAEKFAELIIQGCIDKIETYHIPVGNSASGELACEWTYAALKEIRDDIKESFGITDA
jgi:hypothetical protein